MKKPPPVLPSLREPSPEVSGLLSRTCVDCHHPFLRSKAEEHLGGTDDSICFDCFMRTLTHGHTATQFLIGIHPDRLIKLDVATGVGASIAPIWAAKIQTELWSVGLLDGSTIMVKAIELRDAL